MMLQHLIVQFLFNYLSIGRLQKVKSKRKFQIFSSKSGRSRSREAVAYKTFNSSELAWKILENWSLRRGDRLQAVVATAGSTVTEMHKNLVNTPCLVLKGILRS